MKQAKFAISGHFLENTRQGWPQICLLMYSDHIQNRLDFGHGMLIFLIWAPFWLSETGHIWGYRDFLYNAWEEWPKIWHADLSWPPLDLITLDSGSIDIPHFGAILTEWNRWNVQFPGIFVTMYTWEEWAEICHVNLYPVISPEMKKTNFSTWKLSSYRAGGIQTTLQSDFLVFCYHRLSKPSPSTTLPRVGV